MARPHLYASIIQRIFQSHFKRGMRQVEFDRTDMVKFANELNIALPKNLGDLIYSFRYRASLPESIQKHALPGETWIIRPAGRAKYRFVLVPDKPLLPNRNLTATKVPDSTPGVVAKYAFNDEQALLAKVRYNRLQSLLLYWRTQVWHGLPARDHGQDGRATRLQRKSRWLPKGNLEASHFPRYKRLSG